MTIEELKTLDVVNLTPAEIIIIARSGTHRFPYSGNHASVESGKIAGLPDAEDGVAYRVSNAVASRVEPDRTDIFSPYRMSYFYRSAANGAITFTAWNPDASPESMWFVQNYRSAYNDEPDLYSALAYTSVYLLFHAITTADSTDSHAIRDVLAQTKDVDMLIGSFSFDEVGDAVYDPHVLIVRDGEFEVFE